MGIKLYSREFCVVSNELSSQSIFEKDHPVKRTLKSPQELLSLVSRQIQFYYSSLCTQLLARNTPHYNTPLILLLDRVVCCHSLELSSYLSIYLFFYIKYRNIWVMCRLVAAPQCAFSKHLFVWFGSPQLHDHQFIEGMSIFCKKDKFLY